MHVRGGQYECSCGSRRPTEEAYLDALCRNPFLNTFLLANVEQRGELTVSLGLTKRVMLSPPMDAIAWVRAQPSADYDVSCAVTDIDPGGFSVTCGTLSEPVPSAPVLVQWFAAGYRGEDRPPFIEFLARAFHALWEHTLRQPRAVRTALLEGVIGFEMFVAWYLRKFVWTDPYFDSSNNNADLVARLITEAGITNLARVPLRVALRNLNLYRVFEVLKLPTEGGCITLERLLKEILSAVTLRNKVVHEGLEVPDERLVERGLGAAYFLIEAFMFQLADQHAASQPDGIALEPAK